MIITDKPDKHTDKIMDKHMDVGTSILKKIQTNILIRIEEVPVKWMDRPCATGIERGHAYEMDGRKSAKKNGNATEIDQMSLQIVVPV